MAVVDGRHKTVRIGQVFHPTEDMEADMKTIKGYFARNRGDQSKKEVYNAGNLISIKSIYSKDHIMPSSLASTPPMGWNSWNTFGHAINETVVRETADALVSTGLKDHGYNYIVIDDCWSIKDRRDGNGDLIPDPEKFPNGIKALADYVHEKGFKLGIYSDAARRPARATRAVWGSKTRMPNSGLHGASTSSSTITVTRRCSTRRLPSSATHAWGRHSATQGASSYFHYASGATRLLTCGAAR
jgi:hypothetical protein